MLIIEILYPSNSELRFNPYNVIISVDVEVVVATLEENSVWELGVSTLFSIFMNQNFVTLFSPIVVFCGTYNILWNILHIHDECDEYEIYGLCECQYVQYSSHSTWMWVIFYKVLSTPQNTAMDLNNVMSFLKIKHVLK